jgi:hypothetical protein
MTVPVMLPEVHRAAARHATGGPLAQAQARARARWDEPEPAEVLAGLTDGGWIGSWGRRAVCAHPYLDPDMWYPHPTDLGAIRRARATCEGCPVRRECLGYAMRDEGATGHRNGMWGGLMPDERAALYAELERRVRAGP